MNLVWNCEKGDISTGIVEVYMVQTWIWHDNGKGDSGKS